MINNLFTLKPCTLWILISVFVMSPGLASEADITSSVRSSELVFLNWSEYLDPNLVKEFERRHNTKIREIYFESDDTRDDMLVDTEGRGYDLVMVNGIQMQLYRQRNWLAPVSTSDVPNLQHVDPRWINAFEAANGYGVPYFWGTLGIGYRTDLVPEKITSWKQLFQPHEALRGKIVMNKQSRDLIGMALKALGYSANSSDRSALTEAEQLIMAQKPYVKRYGYVDLSEKSALVTGEIIAAMIFNGDALMVQEHHRNIAYVLPEEGSNLWVDYLTEMASSSKKELAMAFINFLNEPQNAARLAEFVYYPTPNRAAEKLLPADFLEDPVIYPSPRALEKSEFYAELTPRALRKRNSIFAAALQ